MTIEKQKSKTILVVDDDSTARYGMRRALEESYKILEAESAAAARRVLAAENPHLLLLDIEMPQESGLTFLQELKAKEDFPAVIMITAYGSEKVAVEAMKSGAMTICPNRLRSTNSGWWCPRLSSTWTWQKRISV